MILQLSMLICHSRIQKIDVLCSVIYLMLYKRQL